MVALPYLSSSLDMSRKCALTFVSCCWRWLQGEQVGELSGEWEGEGEEATGLG